MNRESLFGNMSSALSVDILQNSMKDKNVLILDKVFTEIAEPSKLRAFFDIIICETDESASWIGNPDIYISKRASPYVNSVLDIDKYNKYKDCILIISYDELDEIKKNQKRLNNYILSCRWSGNESGQLSLDEPGYSLTSIGGSAQIIASYGANAISGTSLKEYLNHKTKYFLTNIRRPQRANFIREVLFNV